MEKQSDLMKVTGLYSNVSKSGDKYLSGNLSYSTKLMVFKNKFKEKDSDPDMILYICPRTHEKKDSDTADNADVF